VVFRRSIIGVMGSGDDVHDPQAAAEVGRLIAGLGYDLLTGAGQGVMAAVAKAFTAVSPRQGISIGVVPAKAPDDPVPPTGYPNEFVELPIYTHLGRGGDPDALDSRNPVNVLTASAIILLPGNDGTYAELQLAASYDRPRILYLGEGSINGFKATELAHLAPTADSIAELRVFLEAALQGTLPT
jgi:uncharacterized protein (TIGR00725 family)